MYKIQDRKRTQAIYYDLLKKCESHVISFWLRKKLSKLLGIERNENAGKGNTTTCLTSPPRSSSPAREVNCGPPDSMNSAFADNKSRQIRTKSGRAVKRPMHFADGYE